MLELVRVKDKETGETVVREKLNTTGKMKSWLPIALNKQLWKWHINKLKNPGIDIPRPHPNNAHH